MGRPKHYISHLLALGVFIVAKCVDLDFVLDIVVGRLCLAQLSERKKTQK